MEMKAITLWQPWASLIVDGRKIVETRPMPWYYEGPVAIHAGLKVDREACLRFGYNPDLIPTGAVLGVAQKTGLYRFEKKLEGKQYEPDQYGDFTPGRYGYPLTNLIKFAEPIPAKGKQGFWDWCWE
jgi:activating signal cointegrator 1